MNSATIVFEVGADGRIFMHHSTLLLRDKRFDLPLTFRWDYYYRAWFWVRGHGTQAR